MDGQVWMMAKPDDPKTEMDIFGRQHGSLVYVTPLSQCTKLDYSGRRFLDGTQEVTK